MHKRKQTNPDFPCIFFCFRCLVNFYFLFIFKLQVQKEGPKQNWNETQKVECKINLYTFE